MVPITKNIRVIDEQGNEYEATYPKRAKGLIKSGRARFINDDVICLACPPDNINLEDIIMNNDNKNIFNETMNGDHVFKIETPIESPVENTWEYALKQIEKITNDTKELRELHDLIGEATELEHDTIVELVSVMLERELTNRRLIEFYQNMYNDLKPANDPHKKSDNLLIGLVHRKIEAMDPAMDMEDFADQIRTLNDLFNDIIGE